MAKNFDTKTVANKFFTQGTTEVTQTSEVMQTSEKNKETQKKAGRPKEIETTYRFSLYLNGDYKEFIDYIVWKKKYKNITRYLNDLIRADMEAYIEAGGDESEWMKED